MLDAAGNVDNDGKHASSTLKGISASSSSRELAYLVCDVDGGSSVDVDRILVTGGVLTFGGTI